MSDQASEKKTSCSCVKSGAKLIIGGILVILGLIAVAKWWVNLLVIISGVIGLFLILAGAITIAIAKE